MIIIPGEEKEFFQNNANDRLGTIWKTKNISLDDEGYIALADRSMAVWDTSSVSAFGTASGDKIAALVPYTEDKRMWIVGTNHLYRETTASPDVGIYYIKDTKTGTPSLDTDGNNDMVEYNSQLVVVNDSTHLYHLSGASTSAWLTASLDSGQIGNSLAVFSNTNELVVGGASTVKTYDTTFAYKKGLTLPDEYTVTCLAWSNQRLYIGTMNTSNGNAVIFEWDGLSLNANNGYPVNGHTVYAMTSYRNGVAFVTSSGELGLCTTGIEILDRFPIWYKRASWSTTVPQSTYSNQDFPVTKNGMVADGDNLYINLTNQYNHTMDDYRDIIDSDFAGGMWCYNPERGLYHRWSPSISQAVATYNIAITSVDTILDYIYPTGVTIPETGTPCFYFTGPTGNESSIPELQHGLQYFVIKINPTTMQLASSYANAIAGTKINFTGSGNNEQFITLHPNNSFGAFWAGGGAVAKLDSDLASTRTKVMANKLYFGSVMASNTDMSYNKTYLQAVQKYHQNRGYFITPKLESSALADLYVSLGIKWKKMDNIEDKIIIKYRVGETKIKTGINANDVAITWSSSTIFTTTEDLSDVSVGDEVEFISGEGAGYMAHISNISEAGGTYTVTIDESIENITISDRARIFLPGWTKLDTISYSDTDQTLGYRNIGLGVTGKWIQFKIELRGQNTTIEELIINNKPHAPVV